MLNSQHLQEAVKRRQTDNSVITGTLQASIAYLLLSPLLHMLDRLCLSSVLFLATILVC